MNISYSVNNKPVITTSTIVSSDLDKAIFYLDKDPDAITYELEFNNNVLDFASQIYSTEALKTIFKIKTNTTDILVTNVILEDVPYYYEVVTSDNTYIALEDLLLNSAYEAKEYNGKLYTNNYFTNYEIKDGLYIHSKPVINPSVYNVKYYSDHILVSVPKGRNETLAAQTRSDSCISLTKVSNYKVELPSFYIKTRSKVLQFIKGDVVQLNKKEFALIEGNFITPKDKAISVSSDVYVDPFSNIIFSQDSYLSSKEFLLEYTAERNNHIFEVQDEVFFKLDSNNIITATAADYDFRIKRKMRSSSINVYPNPYLKVRDFGFNANSVGVTFGETSEKERKMFTQYVKSPSYIRPSETVYIKDGDATLYQSFEDLDIYIPVVPKQEVLAFLNRDYELPPIQLPSLNEAVNISDIETSYYLKD